MVASTQHDSKYIPVRGDVVKISFDPQAGKEIWGNPRPALVLSPYEFNRLKGVAIVCPITRTNRGDPFEVEIPEGLDVCGVIRADQVKSLDWQVRKAEFLCSMPPQTVWDTADIVHALIWAVAEESE